MKFIIFKFALLMSGVFVIVFLVNGCGSSSDSPVVTLKGAGL